MRILYAGSVDLSANRGDTWHFINLAEALSSQGHQLDIVAFNKLAHPFTHNLNIYPIRRSTTPKIYLLINDLKLLRMINFLSDQFPYDIFYQRGIPYANRILSTRGVPAFLEVNGIRIDELRLRGQTFLGLQLQNIREIATIAHASHYICVTQGILNRLVELYRVDDAKCTVISNAANTNHFIPLPQKQCQQLLGLPSGKFHIGFVGTFQPWVDFDTLFTALRLLIDQDVPVYCSLVGDGKIESILRKQTQYLGISDIVNFAGRQSHQIIPQWLGAFDVCIAPFKKARNLDIGLSPLKLFEYMACERPVLAPILPGIVEPVETAKAGILYPIEEPKSLAKEILWLYENPSARQSMGKGGREYVLTNHNWSIVAKKIEKLFQYTRNNYKMARG